MESLSGIADNTVPGYLPPPGGEGEGDLLPVALPTVSCGSPEPERDAWCPSAGPGSSERTPPAAESAAAQREGEGHSLASDTHTADDTHTFSSLRSAAAVGTRDDVLKLSDQQQSLQTYQR